MPTTPVTVNAPRAAVNAATPDDFTTFLSDPETPRLSVGVNMNNPHSGRNPAPEDFLYESDPRRKASVPARADLAAARDGWDHLVDGPMPEDGDLAWKLWDAWRAAEGGPEALEAEAWERYCRWARGDAPVPVGEPLADTLQRVLSRAVVDGATPETVARIEELLEEFLRPKAIEAPPGWEHGVSAFGWYVSFAQGGERNLCANCVPQPPDGVKARLERVYPVEPWMFDPDTELRCAKCGDAKEVAA